MQNKTHRFATIVLGILSLVGIWNVDSTSAKPQIPATRTIDFDGDGRTDVALFDSRTGQWHIYDFFSGVTNQYEFGAPGDRQVVGDYDGDGFSDFAVCSDDLRSGLKVWHIGSSVSDPQTGIAWGIVGDIPVPRDYDGDSRTDFAVFRPSNGTWYIYLSESASLRIEQFGEGSDKLVPADYDGDGVTDIAFMRIADNTWNIRYSRDDINEGFAWNVKCADEDIMVPADYDGDGRADMAVYRVSSGFWTILQSESGTYRIAQFGYGVYTGDSTPVEPSGSNVDMPMPGDYDGDYIVDLAVWSVKTRIVNVLPSQSSLMTSVPVGNNTSRPVSLSIVMRPNKRSSSSLR